MRDDARASPARDSPAITPKKVPPSCYSYEAVRSSFARFCRRRTNNPVQQWAGLILSGPFAASSRGIALLESNDVSPVVSCGCQRLYPPAA